MAAAVRSQESIAWDNGVVSAAEIGFLDFRIAEQFGAGAAGDDFTSVEDVAAVGEIEGEAGVLFYQQQGQYQIEGMDNEQKDDTGLGLIGSGIAFQKIGILKKTFATQRRFKPLNFSKCNT